MVCACFFLPCVCVCAPPPAFGTHLPPCSRSRGRTSPNAHLHTTPHDHNTTKKILDMQTLARRLLHHAIITSIPHLRHLHQLLSSFAHNSATASLNKSPCSTSQACRAVPLLFPHMLYPLHLLRPAAACPDQSSHQKTDARFFLPPKPCT
ncbi:hypothetical protein COCSADRAFT_36041 [Bipolaris sorokiniana ND90Pr]|uniref:Secreted protein n=1 Tax=Cochliobolus sativus (strain ND90Pr / ATCC 201652) TaxID=665912 RepID=M2T630_COCSN|nr:uncharacterized protein COCSADRAFT_36041 [Bipolaris sorokiniana ND90Pr]EMD64666.1 hypothetical protein COCSADRAFT_36041 [Bipolaris sorokiniana ND90Pr]